jgi:multidrug efflux pump subunit AcrB
MGIVRFALRFPHTFYVVAALILFLGSVACIKMPTDIFPEINIPVVTVIWSYTGLSTPEMEQRVTTYSQYSISANVNGIKNIEAQTMAGLSVQKIYFQPDVNLDLAIAQIVSATNAIRALMPPGIQPPIVVQFNASSVPVLQISLSSDTLSEQQLYDYGIYRIRQQLAPIPGITLPTPAGGKYRQIMVDIDPAKLLAKGLTPLDVVNAVNTQNLTLPAGTAKFGNTQYVVRTNATPPSIDDLNNIPIKVVNGATSSSGTSAKFMMAGWSSKMWCATTATARCCSRSSRTATPRRSPWSMPCTRRCRRREPRLRRACRSPNCSTNPCS